ncbi:MAG: glycosyltransferase [Gammaproteobacteria bacterium]
MIPSAHLIASRRPGGAEGFYCRLVKALAAEAWPVYAVHPPGSAVGPALGGAVSRFEVRMLGTWDILARHRIARLLRRLATPIVQTYLGRASRLTRLEGRPDQIHLARLGGYYDLEDYRHAQAFVAVTQGLCDYLVQNGIPAGRVFHIPNFVDTPKPEGGGRLGYWRERLGLPHEAWVVVTVGRLHPVKGLDVLLAALARAPGYIEDWPVHLVIVGDGPLHAVLDQEAHALGLSGRVHLVGWQIDPGPYYRACDLVVCASRQETFGNTVLEAWAYGRAVLSTRTAGPLEIITHGEDGSLVPAEDPAALAQGLERLLKGVGTRHDLGEAGRKRLALDFSRERIVQQYQALYETLAG